MWCQRYFPGRYWAARYWPKVATVITVAGPYYFTAAVLWCPGAVAGACYVAGAASGSVYVAGAAAGQLTEE